MAAGTELALLAVDLDRFKSVNDQFGHIAGDLALAAVGERLQAVVEPTDLVAHVSLLGQVHRQVRDLPPGTTINEIRIEPRTRPFGLP